MYILIEINILKCTSNKEKRKKHALSWLIISDIHSNSMSLDFSFDRSDELPLDVFEDIFANYEKRK